MSSTKTKKTFDCIAFKEQAQARIHKETRGLSRQELVEYFQRSAAKGPLAKFRKRQPRMHIP